MPTAKSKTPLLAISLLVVLAGGVGIGLYLGNSDRGSSSGAPGLATASEEEIEAIRRIPKPKAPPSLAPSQPATANTERPPINALEGLNAPDTTARNDIRILDHLFQQTHTLFHQLPIGDNRDITAFLLGDNPKNIAYFQPDNPNLNPEGEIIDRWGTPYFFHSLSRHQVEIRSAGPDRLHWSEDDIVSETVESQGIVQF